MKLGTTTHPKFRRLQKMLKIPQYAVTGLLEMIWSMASQYADDGDISRFSNQEIADYCDWEGDADQLIEALIACRWVDRVGERLEIHDWEDHRPNYISDRIRKRKPLQDVPESSGAVRDFPEHSGNFQEIPGKSSPSQAKPSPALGKPSPTKPNHASASSSQAKPDVAADADAEAAIFGLMEGLDMEEVFLEASKLRKAAPSLELQYVWESAVIARVLKPGFCGDVASGIKTGEIRKAKPYIDSAFRSECDERGVSLTRLRAQVPPCPVQEATT